MLQHYKTEFAKIYRRHALNISISSTQTSAKEDIIFGMKNQISIASASICLVFLISKPVTLVEKLTMNVWTDLELQIPVG